MSFRELVERVVNEVPGCVNCTLLGYDGISIDSVDNPEALEGISAADATVEYAYLVKQVRSAAEGLASGEVEDVCIRSEKMATVLRPLTDEYLISATLTPAGLVGKGRYLLRVVAPQLLQELS